MPAGGQVCVNQAGVGGEHQLVEPRRGAACEIVIDEFAERRSGCEVDSRAERRGGLLLVAVGGGSPTVGDESLEPVGIDVVDVDVEEVAGRPTNHRLAPQQLAQNEDLGLQRVGRVGALLIAPERLDEPVIGDGMWRGECQHGHDDLQLGAGHGRTSSAALSLDHPEQGDPNRPVHVAHPRSLSTPPQASPTPLRHT